MPKTNQHEARIKICWAFYWNYSAKQNKRAFKNIQQLSPHLSIVLSTLSIQLFSCYELWNNMERNGSLPRYISRDICATNEIAAFQSWLWKILHFKGVIYDIVRCAIEKTKKTCVTRLKVIKGSYHVLRYHWAEQISFQNERLTKKTKL